MIGKKKGAARLGRTPRKKPSSTHNDTPLHLGGQELALFTGRDDEIAIGDSKERLREHQTSPQQVTAADLLSEELREKVELIRELTQRADLQEIGLRYEIALHCRDVKDGDGNKFGDGAVQKLADALGWAPAIIYDYAKVARAWKCKEQAVAAAQAMNRGWRHLVEIAIAPAEKQEELIAAVRDEGMSVRALRKHRKKLAPAASRTKPAPSLEDITPSISLTEALQDLAVDLTQFEEHGGPHADRLADALAKAEPTDITPEFAKGLLEIRNRLETISKKLIAPIDAGLAAGKQASAKHTATKAKPMITMVTMPTEVKPKPTKSTAKPKTEEFAAISQDAEVASPA